MKAPIPRPLNPRTLTLAFARPGAGDHWMNHLTARISRNPVFHVELHFESLNQCFSIQWGEQAGLRAKSLANPNYSLISLAVSNKEYDAALEFCQKASKMALEFSDSAMFRSYVNPCACAELSSQDSGYTFCSKVITEALQFAGLPEVERLTPACATPSRLMDAVSGSHRRTCNSVPYKRNEMLTKGVT